MILLLESGLDVDAIRAVEAAVRRAGGEPRRLFGRGDGRSATQPGQHQGDAHEAIEAKGADPRALGDIKGVAAILDAASGYPRVARDGHAPEGSPPQHGLRAKEIVIAKGKSRSCIGGAHDLVIIAGPCAVEGAEQVEACARAASDAGATILRGGAFKPRTSPYSFQGLGEEALFLLRSAADRHGLAVVTEVMDTATVGLVAEYADVLQVGSRNMQNFALLRAVGRQRRPVVLKRGMSATLDEWLLAAEYVADSGNDDIILCERGVRTFDPASRNMLDLAAVPLLRARTHLPIIVDPSHGVGVRCAIGPMAVAAAAVGADGIMLECHPEPGSARSDGSQALTLEELAIVAARVREVARLARGPLHSDQGS